MEAAGNGARKPWQKPVQYRCHVRVFVPPSHPTAKHLNSGVSRSNQTAASAEAIEPQQMHLVGGFSTSGRTPAGAIVDRPWKKLVERDKAVTRFIKAAYDIVRTASLSETVRHKTCVYH